MKWRAAYKPFHWFVEFHGILQSGGFAAIAGNPPYVEYSKVRREYTLRNFDTESAGNLYAFCTERSFDLARCDGSFGFIVQAPVVSTGRMHSVRALLRNHSSPLVVSTYDDRPSKLFDGMHHCRLAILLSRMNGRGSSSNPLFTTRYKKWYKAERATLFQTLEYLPIAGTMEGQVIPKFRTPVEVEASSKVLAMRHSIGDMISPSDGDHMLFYKITGVGHWFTFTTSPPRFSRDGTEGRSTRENTVAFPTQQQRDIAFCCLYSTLHYWLYQARTNCRDFNPSDIRFLPLPGSLPSDGPLFTSLRERIVANLEDNSETGSGNYAVGGSVQYQRFRPGRAGGFQ